MIPSKKVPAIIPYTMGLDDQVIFNDLNWWEPDSESLSGVIYDIVHDVAPSKISCRKAILEKYSWDNATDQLVEILESIELK